MRTSWPLAPTEPLLPGGRVVPADDLLGDATIASSPLSPPALRPPRMTKVGEKDAYIDNRCAFVELPRQVGDAVLRRPPEVGVGERIPVLLQQLPKLLLA